MQQAPPPEPFERQPGRPRRRLNTALLLRRIHGYIGVLIAPSVLFFAATGGFQLFSLHEAHGGYDPPAVLVALASVHKDQRLPGPKPHMRSKPAHDEQDVGADRHAGPKPSTWLLKWAFLGVALGLIASTCLGLWMAFQDRRRLSLNIVLSFIGILVPVLLIIGQAL